MNSIYEREKVLVGKKEQVYGQEEALSAATDAIRTLDCKISWNKEREELNEDGVGLDHGISRTTSENVGIDFKTYFSGSGAGGSAIPWAWLAEICGFEEVLDAGPPGTATLRFANVADSATLHYRNGPNKHPVFGTRGNMKIDLSPKKTAMLEFALRGLRGTPVNEQYPASIGGVAGYFLSDSVNYANTTVAKIFGVDVCLTSCAIDIGNQVPHIDLPNCSLIDITKRAAVANVSFLDPGIGVQNFYDMDTGELGEFAVHHSDGKGGLLKVGSAAGAQFLINDVGEFEGRTSISATIRFARTPTGGSDFQIVNEYAA